MTFATTDRKPATWCVGVDRPPHVTDTVRPRKPDMLPRCDACELARRREGRG